MSANASHRIWATISIGIVFIATTAYNTVDLFFNNCTLDWFNVFAMVLNILVSSSSIIRNIYLLYTLLHNSFQGSATGMKLHKSFVWLFMIFTISWTSCYIQTKITLIYNIIDCPILQDGFLSNVSTVCGIVPFIVIGIEYFNANNAISVTQLDSIFAAMPFILFNLKFYSLFVSAISIYELSMDSVNYAAFRDDSYWWDYWDVSISSEAVRIYFGTVISFSSISLLCGIILWFQIHSYTKQLLVYHVQHTQITTSISNSNGRLNTESRRAKFYNCYNRYKSVWKRYKFWNQNYMIIATSTVAIFGAWIHWLQHETYNTGDQLTAVGVICGSIIFFSISSMCIYKFQCCCCLLFVSADNKFRLLCVVKTTLLLVKQFLIYQIDTNIWKWVFRILSILSLISIAIITYAFDHVFVKELTHMKHAKLFYITYGVSYFVTNISTAVIVIASLYQIPRDDQVTIVIPFLFLYFSKLYNNEYSRYKEYIKGKLRNEVDNKQLPCTIASLYHVQQVVVMMSSMTLVVLLLANRTNILGNSGNVGHRFDLVIQMVFSAIIILNGIVILYILKDENNDIEHVDNIADLYIQHVDNIIYMQHVNK
eukprot:424865_1